MTISRDNRSWSISWNNRGWGISWGWGSIWNGSSLVFDISNISRLSIKNTIGDNLGSTIGKCNTVFSIGGVSIAVLIGSKVSSTVSIIDGISIVICWGDISINWSWAIGWSWSISWSWGILGCSTGNSQESREGNEALKRKFSNTFNTRYRKS